jgi:hypothetical protein
MVIKTLFFIQDVRTKNLRVPKIGDITKTMPKITLETFQRKFLVEFFTINSYYNFIFS